MIGLQESIFPLWISFCMRCWINMSSSSPNVWTDSWIWRHSSRDSARWKRSKDTCRVVSLFRIVWTIVWPSLAAEKTENLPCHRTILRHETISKTIICRPIQTAAPFTIDFHVFCIERTTKNFGRFFFSQNFMVPVVFEESTYVVCVVHYGLIVPNGCDYGLV